MRSRTNAPLEQPPLYRHVDVVIFTVWFSCIHGMIDLLANWLPHPLILYIPFGIFSTVVLIYRVRIVLELMEVYKHSPTPATLKHPSATDQSYEEFGDSELFTSCDRVYVPPPAPKV